MDVLYILLGGKVAKSAYGMSPAMFVTYGEAKDDSPESVHWSTEDPYSNSPISYLISQAEKNTWKVEVERVLQRYDAETSREQWLASDPRSFAQPDIGLFERSNAVTQRGQPDARIVRDLKHVAQKIVDRQTVFVFPVKWPDKIVAPAIKLTGLMVTELCNYFPAARVGEKLPWSFLSMEAGSGNQDVLGGFIRSLHSNMLAGKNRADIAAWRQKGGSILLSGPTGSGKSYAARLLASDTGKRPVEVNLAGVAERQLESRMRGYIAGTFTDADKKGRQGWFEEANGGVLFLDEFQSVSMASQVQLLDVLNAVSDDIQIARMGEDHLRKHFNVKVILAINEEIEDLLREKRLRKDIYYRVRHIEKFPSLKERLDDDDPERHYLHGLLASYRWKSLRTIEQLCLLEGGWRDMVPTFFPVFSSDALSELASQSWGGNFRELERVAFDLFYECDYRQQPTVIDAARVTNVLQSWHAPTPGNSSGNAADSMTEVERRKLNDIQQALRKSGFVIASVLKNQPYFKSRPPLKRYLRDHVDKLAGDVRSDFRMARVLGLRE